MLAQLKENRHDIYNQFTYRAAGFISLYLPLFPSFFEAAVFPISFQGIKSHVIQQGDFVFVSVYYCGLISPWSVGVGVDNDSEDERALLGTT